MINVQVSPVVSMVNEVISSLNQIDLDVEILELSSNEVEPLIKPKKKHTGPRKRRPKKKKKPKEEEEEEEEEKKEEEENINPNAKEKKEKKFSLSPNASPYIPLSTVLVSNSNQRTGRRRRRRKSVGHIYTIEEEEQRQRERERAYWSQWAIEAAEKERERRLEILHAIDLEEEQEILRRRQWALEAIEKEQEEMMRELFLANMKNTHWFQSTISHFAQNYEVVCPHSWFGCTFSCMLKDLDQHVAKCVYRQVPDRLDQVYEQENLVDLSSYDVVCPNALLGCTAICAREHLAQHLATKCPVNARLSREKEIEERLIWRKNVIQATEQERTRRIHEDPVGLLSCHQLQHLYEQQTKQIQQLLHQEIIFLANQNQQNMQKKKPLIKQAINQIQAIITQLWPKNTTKIKPYGSFVTNLHGEFSDVDLVVLIEKNHDSESESESESDEDLLKTSSNAMAVKRLADRLNQENNKNGDKFFSEINAITHASIPLLKVHVLVESDLDDDDTASSKVRIPLDITFDDTNRQHTGLASASLLLELNEKFYGFRELTLVLKHFLAKRQLRDAYRGGLSSYALVLMVIFVLQQEGHESLVQLDESEEEDNQEDTTGKLEHDRIHIQRQHGHFVAQKIIQRAVMLSNQQKKKKKQYPRRKKRRTHSGNSIGSTSSTHSIHSSNSSSTTNEQEEGRDDHGKAGERQNQAQRDRNEREAEEEEEEQEEEEEVEPPYLLGKFLMDFLQFFGNDFRQHLDIIDVLGDTSIKGEGQSVNSTADRPSSPVDSASTGPHQSGLVILDPLQPDNNVGKNCYRVSKLLREFSDFLSFLTALIVRGGIFSKPLEDESTTQKNGPQILSRVFDMVASSPRPSSTSTSTGSASTVTGVVHLSPLSARSSTSSNTSDETLVP